MREVAGDELALHPVKTVDDAVKVLAPKGVSDADQTSGAGRDVGTFRVRRRPTRSIDPMIDALPDPPDLDPVHLSSSSFHPGASWVRADRGERALACGRCAAGLAGARRRLVEPHRRPRAAGRSRLATSTRTGSPTVLGEETARIIAVAREAAVEMRAKAEAEAASLSRRPERSSTETADALVAEVDRRCGPRPRRSATMPARRRHSFASRPSTKPCTARTEAEAAAGAMRSEATTEAARLREEAATEADRLTSEAIPAATTS